MMDITKLKSVEDLSYEVNLIIYDEDKEIIKTLEQFRQLAIQDYIDSLETVKLKN